MSLCTLSEVKLKERRRGKGQETGEEADEKGGKERLRGREGEEEERDGEREGGKKREWKGEREEGGEGGKAFFLPSRRAVYSHSAKARVGHKLDHASRCRIRIASCLAQGEIQSPF